MLSKLLKYEVKATSRAFLPLFGVLLLFTAINKIFFLLNPSDFSLPQGIVMTVYIITLVGIAVMTLLITIQRFYKNLLGDEGYLMFTLPVRPWQLIASKLMVSGLWSVVSAAVAVLSILVMTIDDLRSLFEACRSMSDILESVLGIPSAAFLAELLLAMLGSLASGIMVVYLSIALGHQLNSKKLLGSFGAFLAVTTAIQSVTTLLIWLFGKLSEHTGVFDWLMDLGASALTHLGMWTTILYEAVIIAVCFALTNWLLNKKLNLE